MKQGKAVKIRRVSVIYNNDQHIKAGYSRHAAQDNSDAQISFMPKMKKPLSMTHLIVKGKKARIDKATRSEYISGMWNFQITFED